MTPIKTMGAIALGTALFASSATQAAAGNGQQASQCFVIYKMAAAAPANAAHKDEIAKLGGLMSRTMQDAKVSKAQFDEWTGELLTRIGSKDKPNNAVLDKEIQTCNTFAKQRYQHYMATARK